MIGNQYSWNMWERFKEYQPPMIDLPRNRYCGESTPDIIHNRNSGYFTHTHTHLLRMHISLAHRFKNKVIAASLLSIYIYIEYVYIYIIIYLELYYIYIYVILHIYIYLVYNMIHIFTNMYTSNIGNPQKTVGMTIAQSKLTMLKRAFPVHCIHLKWWCLKMLG